MAENPYKTPTQHTPLEADGRLTRVWRRFLSGIETLAGRVDVIENILPGIEPGPPLARILVQGNQLMPNFAQNAWTVVPINTVVADVAPVNLSLPNDRISYTNETPNNVFITGSFYFQGLAPAAIWLGYRRNGDDSTIVRQVSSQNRTEFAASVIGACDVMQGDYIEAVIRSSVAQTGVQAFPTIYMQHTGFSPNGS